ncbi:MAG: response regulator, partial [Proteobacteria bacterium]|nr:response regulator [Pseudomonadota bacterium]
MYSILLVDDDKLVLKSLIRLLRSSEYELDCVTSSKAALKQCESGHYHLIISDQRMPGMLGTELLGEIRK